ncbi:MAG: chemotaxis protein CheW [Pseudomonadota bacterium]
MDELIAEFLSETSEGLQTLDNELVEFERDPHNENLLNSIFRLMHTIKGTCGFLGLTKLTAVAHAGENIIDKIRHKELSVDEHVISVVLESIDTIKEIVLYISQHETEPTTDYSALIQKINDTANNVSSTPNQESTSSQEKHEEPVHSVEASSLQTIKVNVKLLENLMQIVSELVLNRNQMIQLDRTIHDHRFAPSIQRLNVITSSLQETVMETRMQPISNAWVKIPRMVRDLAKDLNKKIRLEMTGKDTELDKQLIESIKDPLVHMIRNSADHGLETPEVRIKAGKPEEGVITLKAFHQGGHIIIEASDDGNGINIGRIKSKALQNNLLTEEELALLSENQITQLIFRPGFSTAEVITDISGRGVGLDVVKRNIEEIRGTVELKSIEGKGSTFVIKIPLTLAIMPILVIESEKQKFGIPQINVVEMVRTGANFEYKIEEINENKILRLRDSLLPLITLSDLLQIKSGTSEEKNNFVVVCEVSDLQFGIIVDKIYDTEEIVLKPVSKLLKTINIYSGNTLLGSGEIIMILDPAGIIKHLTILHHEEDLEQKAQREQDKIDRENSTSFLILKTGKTRKAIPLEFVSRLEEIDVTKIEMAADKLVIQYRGGLMFLHPLDPKYKIPETGLQQIVVFGSNNHILGLAVEDIIDIIEQPIGKKHNFEEEEITSAIIGGKTTDIVNINQIFHQVFFSDEDSLEVPSLKKEYKILTVDDSPFFRKIIFQFLTERGFKAISAKTAIEAIELLNSDQKFDLIITDINMPEMDGFEFAKFCQEKEQLKDIPIIALTSNIELGKESNKLEQSGIKNCISKTNFDELMNAIYSLLKIQESVYGIR